MLGRGQGAGDFPPNLPVAGPWHRARGGTLGDVGWALARRDRWQDISLDGNSALSPVLCLAHAGASGCGVNEREENPRMLVVRLLSGDLLQLLL